MTVATDGGVDIVTTLWLAMISRVSGLIGVSLGAAHRTGPEEAMGQEQTDRCVHRHSRGVHAGAAGPQAPVETRGPRRLAAMERSPCRAQSRCRPVVVAAAGDIDEVFWRHSDRIDHGEIKDEGAWFAATGTMEAARLAFVNTAKRDVIGSGKRLDRLPIRRPEGYMPGVTNHGRPSVEPNQCSTG
jgi:hypothetical protein